MKKVLTILLTLFLIVGLCGCKKSSEPEKKEDVTPSNPNEIVVSGITYVVDQDDTAFNISYKVASNMRKVNHGNAISYYSEAAQGTSNFAIRIFNYTDKNLEEAIKDLDPNITERKEVTFGNTTYTYVNDMQEDGDSIKLYFHEQNGEIYAITFAVKDKEKMDALIELFMKNIMYN